MGAPQVRPPALSPAHTSHLQTPTHSVCSCTYLSRLTFTSARPPCAARLLRNYVLLLMARLLRSPRLEQVAIDGSRGQANFAPQLTRQAGVYLPFAASWPTAACNPLVEELPSTSPSLWHTVHADVRRAATHPLPHLTV